LIIIALVAIISCAVFLCILNIFIILAVFEIISGNMAFGGQIGEAGAYRFGRFKAYSIF
jgi:hypothetical protein